MRLLIHAPNVHQGGGRTLLLGLLRARNARVEIAAIVDERLQVPPDVPAFRIVARVPPTVRGRLAAEWRLRWLPGPTDLVLCFGNLPPLFGSQGRVLLFLQNRYLMGHEPVRDLPARARLRIRLERLWLRTRLPRVNRLVVQTLSMALEARQQFGTDALVLPFGGGLGERVPGEDRTRPIDSDKAEFLYVASGEPHKNHTKLLAAWRLLAGQGIHPRLSVTLAPENHPGLCAAIEEERSKNGLAIDNLGKVEPSALTGVYRRCSALIYPSAFESFGLPLLEARAQGVPILAAERDYVRDVVDPVETFDPESPLSIARAVKRFLGFADARVPVLTPDAFIDAVVSDTVSDQ